MKTLRITFLTIGVAFLVGITAFFVVGGGQIITVLRGPKLPSGHLPPGPEGDLEFLRQAVLRNEHGAGKERLKDFETTISTLATTLPHDSETVSIIAARAMAQMKNAHSTLIDPRVHRLPIRVHWLADGLYIVKARPEWAKLLGSRIVTIDGKTPEQLLDRLPQLVAGNASWLRYRSEYFLVAPAAIAFLGDNVRHSAVTLTTADPSSRGSSFSLGPDPDVLPADAFWEWENQLPGDGSFGTKEWRTLLTATTRLPLYQEKTEKLYLLRDLPEHDAVYIRMNGSIDDEDSPLGLFVSQALRMVRESGRKNVIVDFRFNWGGGYDKTAKFTGELPKHLPAGGHIYLITGPNTFSAGLIATARLKSFGGPKVIIVGEPVGDELQFRAEGFLVTLPATAIRVYLSTARHDFQHKVGWFSDYYVLDKFIGVAVESIAPDILVQNTGESYANGRDEVLEAIFERIARQ
jgi:hypothetical protein